MNNLSVSASVIPLRGITSGGRRFSSGGAAAGSARRRRNFFGIKPLNRRQSNRLIRIAVIIPVHAYNDCESHQSSSLSGVIEGTVAANCSGHCKRQPGPYIIKYLIKLNFKRTKMRARPLGLREGGGRLGLVGLAVLREGGGAAADF